MAFNERTSLALGRIAAKGRERRKAPPPLRGLQYFVAHPESIWFLAATLSAGSNFC
jgi:hypothetical protein